MEARKYEVFELSMNKDDLLELDSLLGRVILDYENDDGMQGYLAMAKRFRDKTDELLAD